MMTVYDYELNPIQVSLLGTYIDYAERDYAEPTEPEKPKEKSREEAMDKELELIREWKSIGLTDEEIRERLKKFREGGEV